MTDQVGVSLTVGDRVIFTNGGQGNTGLRFGIIKEIAIKYNGEACLIQGQKIFRGSTEVLYFGEELQKLFKDNYPERFLAN